MARKAILEDPWQQPGDPNKKVLDEFFENYLNYKTLSNKHKQLRWLIQFLYTNYSPKFILDYAATEFRKLWATIDAMPVTKHEKADYWKNIKQLAEFAEDPYRAQNKRYGETDFDYIFSPRFTRAKFREMGKKQRKHYLSPEEWNAFLIEMRSVNPYHYILFKLFLSGCRPIAAANIRVKDINYTNYFYKAEDDKATKANSGTQNRYFFPQEFAAELRWFIRVKKRNPDDLLFKVSQKWMEGCLHKYTKKWTLYDFRRSMKQLWKRAGMDVVDRMVLTNQKAPDPNEDREVRTDAIYSAETEEQYLHRIYEQNFQKIFRNK